MVQKRLIFCRIFLCSQQANFQSRCSYAVFLMSSEKNFLTFCLKRADVFRLLFFLSRSVFVDLIAIHCNAFGENAIGIEVISLAIDLELLTGYHDAVRGSVTFDAVIFFVLYLLAGIKLFSILNWNRNTDFICYLHVKMCLYRRG